MKLLNCILAILLSSNVAYGAHLSELQKTALENRKVIEKYKTNLEKSDDVESIAKSGYYPSLDLGYTATMLDEDSLFEQKENSVAYGAVSWNIFAGFRDKYSIRSAQLLSNAEAFKLQGIEQDIKLNVALRYLSIYHNQANLKVSEDSYATLSKMHEDAKNRFEVGLIKKNELLKFKVDLDNAEITRKKARAGVDKSVFLLQREIDTTVNLDELTFHEFTELPKLAGHGEYEAEMLSSNSSIQLLKETIEASELGIKAEKSRYYPSLDLKSSYQKYDDDYIIGSGNSPSEEIRTQLVLSMNIFDGFGKKSRVNKATLETRTLRYDLEELSRDLTTGLKNLYLDYQVSSSNVIVSESSIEQAEENLRITRLSYEEGLAKESDLLDAISNLSRAKYNFVAAKSEVYDTYFKIIRSAEGL
ncbi:MAG: TolC family protein [Proteobacteria bacterium]|nr:TolC family protein [Pseudomonadota bacterium]MBU1710233.1 TolC family protein [Pseudomonadota bacterium]